MPDPQDILADALAACARGERDGLKIIYDAEAARLVTVAFRILRRHDLAEEIVQEAFLRIWERAHQYERGRGSARGWVYAIVRNRALNALRDGKYEQLTEAGTLEKLQDDSQEIFATDLLREMDDGSRLRQCLGTLDEQRRHGIMMAYVLGYSHGEIAGRLKVPLGTAKAWIRRSLAALRECMA